MSNKDKIIKEVEHKLCKLSILTGDTKVYVSGKFLDKMANKLRAALYCEE